MNRHLVIGDIHGGYTPLLQVLERCNYDSAKDLIIVLGDLCDSFNKNETPRVLDILIDDIPHLILIRGNHDLYLEDWLRNRYHRMDWLGMGGKTTIQAYTQYIEEDPDLRMPRTYTQHLQLLTGAHDYYIDDQGRLFVHGGFISLQGPKGEKDRSILHWDRTLFEDSFKKEKDPRLELFPEIFIGHTETIWGFGKSYSENPVNNHNLWNVDTGCGSYGRLTIMDINTKEYWQSDRVNKIK